MKLILLFKNENNKAISSTLNTLILELKKLHSDNWNNKGNFKYKFNQNVS